MLAPGRWVSVPPVCLSSYLARVWKSTLVRMGENTNRYDSYSFAHSTSGGIKRERKVRNKIFPTCFKISPSLKKKQCYWENRMTAKGASERTFWVVAKANTQKSYITWVIEPTQWEPSIQPLWHMASLIQSKSTRGFLAHGGSIDARRKSAPIAVLGTIDQDDEIDKNGNLCSPLPHRSHGPNSSLR